MPPSDCPTCAGAGMVEVLRRPDYFTRGRVPYLVNCPDCRGQGKIHLMLDDIPLTEEEAARLSTLTHENRV